jgi:acyl-CoA thioesterase
LTLDEMLDGAAGGATTIAPGWGQGRATYGGLVAGLMLSRAETLRADDDRRLRSASVAFVGPVAAGEVFLDGAVLRAGSSATQVQTTLVQDGESRAVLLASFGDDRETAITVAPRTAAPSLPSPDTLTPLPFVPGISPEFLAHFDLHYVGDHPPFSGAPEPDFGGWMRFSSPPARFGDREFITLADAWPPSIMPMLTGPTALSTIAWTFEPIASPSQDDPGAYWQYDVQTHAAADGYAHTSARLWDTAGRLRALSRQTVAYFG